MIISGSVGLSEKGRLKAAGRNASVEWTLSLFAAREAQAKIMQKQSPFYSTLLTESTVRVP